MSEKELSVAPPPSDALLEEVTLDLAALARTRRRIFGIITLLALIGTGALVGYHQGGMSAPASGGTQALHGAILIALVGLALLLYGLAVGLWFPTRRQIRFWAAAATVSVAGLLVMASVGDAQQASTVPGHICLAEGSMLGVVLGALALVLGGRVLRKRAPIGGLIGLAAGVFSLVVLHVVCVDSSFVHLLFWHGASPLLCAFVVTAGWVLLRPDD